MGGSELVVTPVSGADDDLGYVAEILVAGDRLIVVGGTNRQSTVLASSNVIDFERRRGLSTGLRSVVDARAGVYMVGEYGLAALSDDFGATWREFDTGTSGCLFAIERAADGVVWCVGDDGFCARLVGDAWERVDVGTEARLSEIVAVGDRLVLLGFDGVMRVMAGERVTVVN